MTHKPRLRSRILENSAVLKIVSWTGLSERLKNTGEFLYWRRVWAGNLRRGTYSHADPSLLSELSGEQRTVEEAHWAEARALAAKVLVETGVEDPDFFRGKVVVDVGPGCVGMLEASGAALGLAVDPLATRYQRAGLLLDAPAVTYIEALGEGLPMASAQVDAVVARNSLDHCRDPAELVSEVLRVLRPGGSFLVVVDIDQQPNVLEPHTMTLDHVRRLLADFDIEYEAFKPDLDHGGRWRARKPQVPST